MRIRLDVVIEQHDHVLLNQILSLFMSILGLVKRLPGVVGAEYRVEAN